jgi:hypothetical protein
MLFFQTTLLIGYLYVHATVAWLGARQQALLHLAVVLLPFLVLPIAVPEDWVPPPDSAYPVVWLLGLLIVAVGLPFFAVSATNPLIQRWLADTDHPAARDPYFLYRASNLGSVIGLLGYPLAVEPNLTLQTQGLAWTLGYGALALLVFASAFVLWRSREVDLPATTPANGAQVTAETPSNIGEVSPGWSGGITPLRRARWVGLTFVPSSLMLGVTSFITTDVTPVPLLWVIPLSLYLFSFIIVFSPGPRVPNLPHKGAVLALPTMMVLLVITILVDLRTYIPYWMLVSLHLLGFFVVAMVLHGEVARDRPPARHLTEFYLWIAVGGVLGGVFNALIAPLVFDSIAEYPLAMVLACLLLPGALLARLLGGGGLREGQRRSGVTRLLDPRLLDLVLPLALGLAVAEFYLLAVKGIEQLGLVELKNFALGLLIGLSAVVCLRFAYASARPLRFGLGVAALVLVGTFIADAGQNTIFQERSFFGVYKVVDEGGATNAIRTLIVGDTNHGSQVLVNAPPEPSTYYTRTGPVGQLFDEALPKETVASRVALIGLGTGTMACYNQPGQRWTFYEIDPLVRDMASDPNLFTYLRDCPGSTNVVLGDARLKIAEAQDGEYGAIVADAFSSDAIPIHLITREALNIYLPKLKETGVMVFHISNRYFELEPVLGNLARDARLTCYGQFDMVTDNGPDKLASHWVVMARKDADLGDVPNDSRWQPCDTSPSDVWTDDFSNLLSTFNWR